MRQEPSNIPGLHTPSIPASKGSRARGSEVAGIRAVVEGAEARSMPAADCSSRHCTLDRHPDTRSPAIQIPGRNWSPVAIADMPVVAQAMTAA
jgi:hypothetical protein